MLFPLSTMRVFAPRDLTPYPNIRAYLARIAERPAYRRAMEKADPWLPCSHGLRRPDSRNRPPLAALAGRAADVRGVGGVGV